MHLSETKKTTTTKQFKKKNFCSPGLSDRAAQVGQWMVLKRGTGLKGASWVSRGAERKGWKASPGLPAKASGFLKGEPGQVLVL